MLHYMPYTGYYVASNNQEKRLAIINEPKIHGDSYFEMSVLFLPAAHLKKGEINMFIYYNINKIT